MLLFVSKFFVIFAQFFFHAARGFEWKVYEVSALSEPWLLKDSGSMENKFVTTLSVGNFSYKQSGETVTRTTFALTLTDSQSLVTAKARVLQIYEENESGFHLSQVFLNETNLIDCWAATVAINDNFMLIANSSGKGYVDIFNRKSLNESTYEYWYTIKGESFTYDGLGSVAIIRDGYFVISNQVNTHFYSYTPDSFSFAFSFSLFASSRFMDFAAWKDLGTAYLAIGNPELNDVNVVLFNTSLNAYLSYYLYTGIDRSKGNVGQSVAIERNDGMLLFGAPDVATGNSTGLIYFAPICPLNYFVEGNSYSTRCTPCVPGYFTDGITSGCKPCDNKIPKNAEWGPGPGCRFRCVDNTFGRNCLICSDYMGNSSLPKNAMWVNGRSKCYWTCIYGNKTDGNTQEPCLPFHVTTFWIVGLSFFGVFVAFSCVGLVFLKRRANSEYEQFKLVEQATKQNHLLINETS